MINSIKCPQCKNEYNSSTVVPLLLHPCGHNVCEVCLFAMNENAFDTNNFVCKVNMHQVHNIQNFEANTQILEQISANGFSNNTTNAITQNITFPQVQETSQGSKIKLVKNGKIFKMLQFDQKSQTLSLIRKEFGIEPHCSFTIDGDLIDHELEYELKLGDVISREGKVIITCEEMFSQHNEDGQPQSTLTLGSRQEQQQQFGNIPTSNIAAKPYNSQGQYPNLNQENRNYQMEQNQQLLAGYMGLERKEELKEVFPGCKKTSSADGIDFYQYPSANFSSQELVQAKIIMVVGQTGSGKTTLLNALLNFILGVEFKDRFRYQIIIEKTGKQQSQSQTSEVTQYCIRAHNGYPPIVIIDTPGFGDTSGVQKDIQVTDQIRTFFGDRNHDSIHAICFVAKAPDVRLTAPQRYIFSSILKIFGKDIGENFIAMLTFCDGGIPAIVAALEDKESAFAPIFEKQQKGSWHLKFNNSAVFSTSQDQFSQLFWDVGMSSFSTFMKKLNSMPVKSLSQTRDVINERRSLEHVLTLIQPELTRGLNKIEELKQLEVLVKTYADQINQSKNFDFTTTVNEVKKVPLEPGIHTTTCLKCNRTCHDNCAFANDHEKEQCIAMKNGNCEVCPGKCYWDNHSNVPYIFTYIDVQKVQRSEDLFKQYQDANSGQSKAQQTLIGLENELKNVFMTCVGYQEQIQGAIKRLNEIALRPGVQDDEQEYIKLMIIAEQDEKRHGYIGRVRALKALGELYQNMRDAYNNQGNFKQFTDFVQSRLKIERQMNITGPNSNMRQQSSALASFFRSMFK